jgi:tRNA(fMet)-specific endonuclease VapC
MLAFEEDDARTAGDLRAGLERVGIPIDVYDLLLAGQALNRKLTLVTANVSEFSRVKNLSWQDWSS